MIEIERKFTVVGDFSQDVTYSQRIMQGYICVEQGRTVRVRIAGNQAFLTINGPTDKNLWSRYEFEQEIAATDAMELMKLCVTSIIYKERHYIHRGKHTWEVDVFHGNNEGLRIAEIELASKNEPFDKPSWVGKEITADQRYYNAMLSQKPYNQWEKE
jgi:CYTH domain-containing protein